MEKRFNSKCEFCGTIKVAMTCDIVATPDHQPYNNVDYEDTKTDCERLDIFGYTVMYCEKCEIFDEIEKSE